MAPAAPLVIRMSSPVNGHAGAFGEAPRHGGADLGVSGVGHVAVAARAILGDDSAERGDHRFGRFDIGVADRVIEDIFGAALPAELYADLKHAANPGGVLHLVRDRARDSHTLFRSLNPIIAPLMGGVQELPARFGDGGYNRCFHVTDCVTSCYQA